MEQEKVTKKDLSTFKVGEAREFHLPSPNACNSAAVTAHNMQLEGMIFKTECGIQQKLKGIITITRIS